MSTTTLHLKEAPQIETERLILRAHSVDDFPASCAMWSDPAVVRHITGVPSTEQATWFRLMRYIGHWNMLGFGYWAVEEKSSGTFVGEIGFADFKREITPPISGVPEAGWAFASPFHGKGYATESLRAALQWGDEHFLQKRTVCIITPENDVSVRLAQKCGFQEYARSHSGTSDLIMFER